MTIESKEVSKFLGGLVSSASETDLGDDIATFSLDVDNEFEKGALRGIKGNYILTKTGWELPRYARWRIRVTDPDAADWASHGFLLYGYNKTFLIFYNTSDTIPSHIQARANDKGWEVSNINVTTFNTTKQYADATITVINALSPSTAMKNASGIDNYFKSFYTTNSDNDSFIVIRSLFVGDIAKPNTTTPELSWESYNLSMKTSNTHALAIFPDEEFHAITTPSAWDSAKDGKFVKGNGIVPISSSEEMPYGFKFLKNISIKGRNHLFGITANAKAQLLKGIGEEAFESVDLGGITTSANKFNISAEQRNKNLYIGTGQAEGTKSLWYGEVDRTQLDKVFNQEDILEANNLTPLSINSGDITVDNLVMPTLHYGLNSSNGGIAGSASTYALLTFDNINNDVSSCEVRSLHEWARRCLVNAGSSYGDTSNYNAFKKGMIFRLDLGGAFSATSNSLEGMYNNSTGESSFTHLRKLKSFAKGNMDIYDYLGFDAGNISSTTGGSDGEELHSGDLFQIVYVPDAGTIDMNATETDDDLIRFSYVGHLSSDDGLGGNTNPFKCDNAKSYSGTPAYAFGHVNDDKYLYRFKTTSKKENVFTNEVDAASIKNSKGTSIEPSYSAVERIDLEDILGISNLEISTMAECKSADGDGNFGGDTTNKNYYMGYGKLWIADKNDYNHIYLVDITNWDKIDVDRDRVSALRVTLNFDRIHNTLFSTDENDYGKGLIQLWYGDEGVWDKENVALGVNKDYIWNNMDADTGPNTYIASICETYSHKPHLGDGAGGGSAVGDGKWRVWVNYNRTNDELHSKWDLFLFNFRPQAWEQFSGSQDSGTALSSTNKTVYMFDKTPPYQELAKRLCEGTGGQALYQYYPYDKFSFSDKPEGGNGNYDAPQFNDGVDVEKEVGREWISALGGTNRGRHYLGNDSDLYIECINFRNPSGESIIWEALWDNFSDEEDEYKWKFSFGNNLGWYTGDTNDGSGPRKWKNYRHCMKPHFKQWYFTGITGNLSATELDNPVAHIVSFFGEISGQFYYRGGSVSNTENYQGKGNWYTSGTALKDIYDETPVMFTMHDSPVAFASVGGGNNEAQFTHGETQGKPNTDKTNVVTNGNTTNAKFNDTEAGWRTNNSVVATQGYSKFNQYRYNHTWNGTKELYTDAVTVNNRKGYGGAYYGQDEWGHYNMVTITWASNSEPLQISSYSNTNPKVRIYGEGDDEFRIKLRNDSSNDDIPWVKTAGTTEDHTVRPTTQDSDNSDWEKIARTKYGTGYFTYKWPHNEDPGMAGSGTPDDHGDFGEEKAGFYRSDNSISLEGDGTNPDGSNWENRRAVVCYSTTALSDSVYKEKDYARARYNTNNNFSSMVSPRCSFRKVELPSGYKFKQINNMDFISWQEVNESTTLTKHGYIISGEAAESPIKDSEITSTIIAVVDNKSLDNWRIEGARVGSADDRTEIGINSKAAISNLPVLHKQIALNQNAYYSQIVSYTNNNMIFKNLNPGISDCPDSYAIYGTRGLQNNFENDGTPANTYGLLLETYSPLIVGTNGSNNKEMVSCWSRPQFVYNNTDNLLSMGQYPYYKYDKLWNYWAQDARALTYGLNIPLEQANIESGFDNSILTGTDTVKDKKRPTEGYGSTAGTTLSSTGLLDKAYPSDYNDVLNTNEVIGAHTKLIKETILSKYDEEPADKIEVEEGVFENVGVEFAEDQQYYYKISFTYDGFQESPLSGNVFEDTFKATKDCKYFKLTLKIPNVKSLHINSRVTHINVYRKNQKRELYRLVKSISLSQKEDLFVEKDGLWEHKFNDEGATISYEGLNGISETLTHLTPNFGLACQLNDFLFVARVRHPKIENGSHILLRSKQGKFSLFDWSNDFLDLPLEPIAMASFANRVFLFDENNLYIVNPEGMYIEEKVEGVGILNSQSVVVTDEGMFFADRNNIYAHNGRNAVPIGNPILYNHSRPEWQIGYLDAIKKAESLGYTPRIVYDSIKKSIYVILQGYTDADNGISSSYETHKSRIYAFNLTTKRWDYYNSPNINSAIVTSKGDVVLNDGYQIYNYRVDKRNRKSFAWESKEFIMGSSNYDKVFKRLYITGELCLLRFNNIDQTSFFEEDEISEDWGLPPNPVNYEGTDYTVQNDEHELNTSAASESDDLKVYIDGVLQTMRVQNRKPHIGHYLANDKTNSIYTIETQLPKFNTGMNGLVDVNGNEITDAFSLNKNSLPEFIDSPNSQYRNTTKQGELSELTHIHEGQYLYISGIIGGQEVKEIVKVKKVHFKWTQSDNGINSIGDTNSIIIETYRGLLGTKAQNWYQLNATENKRQIRIVTPVLKFPSGTKGKNCKIVFNNQKSYIDSFAITYRRTRMK